MAKAKKTNLFDAKILGPAIVDSFKKLDPRVLIKNPVMFVVEIVSALVTGLFVRDQPLSRSVRRLGHAPRRRRVPTAR